MKGEPMVVCSKIDVEPKLKTVEEIISHAGFLSATVNVKIDGHDFDEDTTVEEQLRRRQSKDFQEGYNTCFVTMKILLLRMLGKDWC